MHRSFDEPLPPDDWVGPRTQQPDMGALYRKERSRLMRFFARRVAPDEVIDMVHETFRRMIGATSERGTRFDNPEAYLTRVADNLARDRKRNLAQRQRDAAVPLGENDAIDVDPVQRLEQRDALRRIEAAIATLKPRTREIFLLHRSDGLSYAEIAERMGMSVKGVEKQMTSALSHLRRQVARAR